jgi:hypothetical protein
MATDAERRREREHERYRDEIIEHNERIRQLMDDVEKDREKADKEKD